MEEVTKYADTPRRPEFSIAERTGPDRFQNLFRTDDSDDSDDGGERI